MRLVLGLAGLVAVAAAAPPFYFDPQPRWADEQDSEIVCEAIRAECAGQMKDESIDAQFTYDDLYDANGQLAGVRAIESTGCKPLDEHLLLSERRFRTMFSEPGKSDLDDIRVELAPGVPSEGVRIVKRGTTTVSMGC